MKSVTFPVKCDAASSYKEVECMIFSTAQEKYFVMINWLLRQKEEKWPLKHLNFKKKCQNMLITIHPAILNIQSKDGEISLRNLLTFCF